MPHSSTAQHRLWRQKTLWCFLVTKCPESGKKGGKQSHWEAHYASFRREALRHGEQRDWLLSNMQRSQETAYQRECARKYPHYYFIFCIIYFIVILNHAATAATRKINLFTLYFYIIIHVTLFCHTVNCKKHEFSIAICCSIHFCLQSNLINITN